MQGRPLADASLITMLSARLFSLPLLDKDLKSLVKNVPIPKVAARIVVRQLSEMGVILQTDKTSLLAMLFERQCLLDVEGIGINNCPLAMIDTQPLVDFLGLRSKDERVTRVLSQHPPTAGAFCISFKVLFVINHA